MSPNGIVTGAADTPGRTEVRGFIWTPASGLVTIGNLGGGVTIPQGLKRGTLGGSHSNGLFVTEAGAIIGVSGVKGHRTHAFVWTEAGGMVEMPSLGRFESVDAASPTGAFTGFTIDKKFNDSLHAVLWAPSSPSSKR
jgi:probable HAF family extracellular repeat protein